jgi:hypothetical protein
VWSQSHDRQLEAKDLKERCGVGVVILRARQDDTRPPSCSNTTVVVILCAQQDVTRPPSCSNTTVVEHRHTPWSDRNSGTLKREKQHHA